MKKLLFSLAGAFTLILCVQSLNAQILNFEADNLGSTTNAVALWAGGSVDVIQNPYQTGINTSSKALRVLNDDYLSVYYNLDLPSGDKASYPFTKVRYKLCYVGPNGGTDLNYPNTDFYSVPGSDVNYNDANTSPAVMKFAGDINWSGVSWGSATVGTWIQCEFIFANSTLQNIPEGKLVIKIAKPKLEYLIDDIELIPVPTPPAEGSVITIADYESYNINDVLPVSYKYNSTDASAVVVADPANALNKAANALINNWDAFLKIEVVLPEGRILANYNKISFDMYLNNVAGVDHGYKNLQVYVNTTNVIDVANGAAVSNTWINKEFEISSLAGGNSFDLSLGLRTSKGNYLIDNVKLYLDPIVSGVENIKEALSVYASGKTIYFNSNAADIVEIYCLSGQKVYTGKTIEGMNSLTLTDSGIYIVKVADSISKIILH